MFKRLYQNPILRERWRFAKCSSCFLPAHTIEWNMWRKKQSSLWPNTASDLYALIVGLYHFSDRYLTSLYPSLSCLMSSDWVHTPTVRLFVKSDVPERSSTLKKERIKSHKFPFATDLSQICIGQNQNHTKLLWPMFLSSDHETIFDVG